MLLRHSISFQDKLFVILIDLSYAVAAIKQGCISNSEVTNNMYPQAFENTSTSVAASQMRNALNNLADTIKDNAEKQVG